MSIILRPCPSGVGNGVLFGSAWSRLLDIELRNKRSLNVSRSGVGDTPGLTFRKLYIEPFIISLNICTPHTLDKDVKNNLYVLKKTLRHSTREIYNEIITYWNETYHNTDPNSDICIFIFWTLIQIQF